MSWQNKECQLAEAWLPFSHVVPTYGSGQRQLKLLPLFSHVPLFLQGLEEHGSAGVRMEILVLFSASLPPWPDFSSCIFWLQKDAFLGATPHVTCAYAPAQRPQEQLWIVAEFIARSNRSQLWVWSSSAPFAISTMELWWGKSLPLIRDSVVHTVAVAEVDALRARCYPGNLSLCTWYGDLWVWHCPAHNRALNLP